LFFKGLSIKIHRGSDNLKHKRNLILHFLGAVLEISKKWKADLRYALYQAALVGSSSFGIYKGGPKTQVPLRFSPLKSRWISPRCELPSLFQWGDL